MKRIVLTAALCAAQPLYAAAQEAAPADPPCRVDQKRTDHASAALPARAGTHPMPERGTIAPAARVPATADTASSRAMAAARAREQAESGKNNTQADCQPAPRQAAPAEGVKKD